MFGRLCVFLLSVSLAVSSFEPGCCDAQFQQLCAAPSLETCNAFYSCQITAVDPIAFVAETQGTLCDTTQGIERVTMYCDLLNFKSAAPGSIPACNSFLDVWCANPNALACQEYYECLGITLVDGVGVTDYCTNNPAPPAVLCGYRRCVGQAQPYCSNLGSWEYLLPYKACLMNATETSTEVIDASLYVNSIAPSCERTNCVLYEEAAMPPTPTGSCASQQAQFCSLPNEANCQALRQCQTYTGTQAPPSGMEFDCSGAGVSLNNMLYCPVSNTEYFQFLGECTGPLSTWATVPTTQNCLNFYGCLGMATASNMSVTALCNAAPSPPPGLSGLFTCRFALLEWCVTPYVTSVCQELLACYSLETVPAVFIEATCDLLQYTTRSTVNSVCSTGLLDFPSPNISVVELAAPPPDCCSQARAEFCAAPNTGACVALMECQLLSNKPDTTTAAINQMCIQDLTKTTTAICAFQPYTNLFPNFHTCHAQLRRWCSGKHNDTDECLNFNRCLGATDAEMPLATICSSPPPADLCKATQCQAAAAPWCDQPGDLVACQGLMSCLTGAPDDSPEVASMCAIQNWVTDMCAQSECQGFYALPPAIPPPGRSVCCTEQIEAFCEYPNPYTCQVMQGCQQTQPLTPAAMNYITNVCASPEAISAIVQSECLMVPFFDKAQYFTTCEPELKLWCENPTSSANCELYNSCMRIRDVNNIPIPDFCAAEATVAPPNLCKAVACKAQGFTWCGAGGVTSSNCTSFMSCILDLPANDEVVTQSCSGFMMSQNPTCLQSNCNLFYSSPPPATPAPTQAPGGFPTPSPTLNPNNPVYNPVYNPGGLVIGSLACAVVVAGAVWFAIRQKRLATVTSETYAPM